MKVLLSLIGLPFLITLIERLIIQPAISLLPLPDTSVGLFKYGSISLLILAISAFRKNSYGLELSKKLSKLLAFMLLLLIVLSYLFLYSLHFKGFLDSFAVVHLVNWIITVFREEFVLRGVIQTEAKTVLSGSFWKISKSIWFASILFSLWHLVNLTEWSWQVVALQMLACLPSGIILGLIREKTGNTLLTYLLHICGDFTFYIVYLLIFGKLFLPLF